MFDFLTNLMPFYSGREKSLDENITMGITGRNTGDVINFPVDGKWIINDKVMLATVVEWYIFGRELWLPHICPDLEVIIVPVDKLGQMFTDNRFEVNHFSGDLLVME